MKTIRRIGHVAAAAAFALAAATAQAEWPEKPVTYVIPFDPGGESDVTARFQERFFEDVTGQRVVIQYKPGAGGATAWAQLDSYGADGHTIMNVNFPHAVLQPALMDVGYETSDVMPVYVFHYTPDAVLVPADSEFETLDDLVQHAKENPGAVTFAGSGTNSANHLAAETFDTMMDVNTTYVPFSGSSPAMAALLGNQVTAAMSYTTQGIKAGDQVRVLAVATDERVPSYPDVPTFTELGHDYVAGAYRGVAVPTETPDEVKQAISDAIGEINAQDEFRQLMEEGGYVLTDVPFGEIEGWVTEREAEYASGIESLQAAN